MNITISNHSVKSDLARIQEAEGFYAGLLEYVKSIFNNAASGNMPDIHSITEKIKTLCGIIRHNRHYLMNAEQHADLANGENYLVYHSIHSAVVAVTIGVYLKLSDPRLIELGVAALLHDIGMLALPPELYLNERPLTTQERKVLDTHPMHSYRFLHSYNYPSSVTTAVREHHERENGLGYPWNLAGDEISLYGKIIAVACSYESASAKRLYKKEKDHYTGMLELVRNEGKRYDKAVIHTFMNTLLNYPAGLYVLLSDGKKGKVLGASSGDSHYPVVQIFGEKSPVKTSHGGLCVTRPLTRNEIVHEKAS